MALITLQLCWTSSLPRKLKAGRKYWQICFHIIFSWLNQYPDGPSLQSGVRKESLWRSRSYLTEVVARWLNWQPRSLHLHSTKAATLRSWLVAETAPTTRETPRLITEQRSQGEREGEELRGIWGRGSAMPAPSFTGQIKTTAEQAIKKREIMNSIILFSVSGGCRWDVLSGQCSRHAAAGTGWWLCWWRRALLRAACVLTACLRAPRSS